MPDTTENLIDDLVGALRERLTIIRDETSRRDEKRHVARLRKVSAKIEELQGALPKPVDPRLAHYLERRSYEKALELLERRRDRDRPLRIPATRTDDIK